MNLHQKSFDDDPLDGTRIAVWDPKALTLRQYLLFKALEYGSGPFLAVEAVSTTAMEHPEWDMDEVKSFAEWEESK